MTIDTPATDRPIPLEERAAVTSGASTWSTTAIPGVLDQLVMADGPHGLRVPLGTGMGLDGSVPATCFPPAVALGSSWDRASAEQVGAALGREAGALGVDVVLGPGMNIKRSPLCGRNFEYLSEDPLLTARLAAGLVTGIQAQGVAACIKHFAVNNQETDRMRVSAVVDERTLREIYLRAFEYVVRSARPALVMSAYNAVNGVPASENPRLLTEILRDEWGFDGVVVSDWGAIRDRVAALRAGCDLEMPPTGTDAEITAAVAAGVLSADDVDRSVQRLVGLDRRLDRSLRPRPDQLDAVRTANAELAHDIALRCPVLLKNDGILPLDAASPGRVAVVGEFARTPRIQAGGSSRVSPTRTITPWAALQERLGDAITFHPGYSLDGDADPVVLRDEAVAAARAADVVLAFLGLPESHESEGTDRTTMALPADQLELLRLLSAANDRVVVVLCNGSVVTVAEWEGDAAAILETWLLGQAGGSAIRDLLLGDCSPSGRLAESIPLRIEDHPSYPSFPGGDGITVHGEGVFVGYRGLDIRHDAVAYEFGYGLTYSSFRYSDVTLDRHEDEVRVSFTLTNTGPVRACEVAQLYVGPGPDLDGPRRPVAELRDFARVDLGAGQSTTVQLRFRADDLAVWDVRRSSWRLDPGTYEIRVGASSRDIRLRTTLTIERTGPGADLTAMSSVAEWLRDPIGAEVIGEVLADAGLDELAAKLPSELVGMVTGAPLDALRSFGLGLDRAAVAALVAEAEARRARRARRPAIDGIA